MGKDSSRLGIVKYLFLQSEGLKILPAEIRGGG